EAAIPILIGDNIGTCTTALIASIGTTITAKRTAFSHLMFNIFGTAIFFILIYVFKLQGFIINFMGGSVPRQIANLHTTFNLITCLVLVPAIRLFEKIIVKIFPGRDIVINKNALYLEKRLIPTPALAMEQAKRELYRVAGVTNEMLNLAVERISKKDTLIEKKLLDREAAVDSITEDIIRYLTNISQNALAYPLSNELTNLLHIAYDIERTGDHAESIMYLAIVKEENKMVFSRTAGEEVEEAHRKASEIYLSLLEGIEENNLEKIKECERLESELDGIVKKVRTNHLIRLQKGECMPLSGVVFADIILHLERIGDLLYGVSRNLLNIG
ncbi:MAG: Na/Pi cotransporter family protein, partial [Actinobacteria bacterium]|nr:Na/Pi cotransporter family protein [Actinomycetota bacterium]